MALDDNDSTSSAPPSSSLPVPPSSASSSRTDSKVPSVGSAVAPVALDVGSVGSGGGSSGEGAGGAIRGQEVVETKSACTKGSMAEAQGLQSDLEKGESGGGSRGPPERAGALKAGATPSLSWTSSSSRRFKLWGRGKARSWPTVLPNDEEGGKWEGGWGEKGGEAKEEGEARGEAYGPPESPPSISVLSSLQSSMHDMVGRIEARLHQMPKWQYRLMFSSIIFLFLSLALLLFVSVVYGFGMSLPHIEVVDIKIVSPLPADGSIPIRALMRVNNPNRFSITARPTSISIHTHPSRSAATQLGVAAVPEQRLGPHDDAHVTETTFVVRDVNGIEGGLDIVKAVLAGKATYLYTRTVAELTLMSLGYMSIGRHYISECTILKHWGENLLLSDCYGRFTRS